MFQKFKRFIKKILRHKRKPFKIIYPNESDPKIAVVPLNNIENQPKIYTIQKGRIDTDNLQSDCYFIGRKLISPITFSYSNGLTAASNNNIYKRYVNSKKPKNIDGVVFSLLCGGAPNRNYYHWLFDSIPKLELIKDARNKIDYFYVPSFYKQKFKKESLSYFNIIDEQIIDSHEYPHIKTKKQIIACTHHNPGNPNNVPKWICSFLRKSFITHDIFDESEIKKIYISREGASCRRIINEDLILSKLTCLGFKKFKLENISFHDQITLFANADIVVAPHGAGLANIIFCKPGTKIVELMPSGHNLELFNNNRFFYLYQNIARYMNLNYEMFTGTGLVNPTSNCFSRNDFFINEQIIEKIIEIIWLKN